MNYTEASGRSSNRYFYLVPPRSLIPKASLLGQTRDGELTPVPPCGIKFYA